jgi:hypothetical protein
MEHSFNRAKSYKIRRVGETQFQVVFAGKSCDPAFVRRYIDDWPSASNKMDVDVEDNIHDGGEEVCLRDGAEDGDEEDCLHDDVFSLAEHTLLISIKNALPVSVAILIMPDILAHI